MELRRCRRSKRSKRALQGDFRCSATRNRAWSRRLPQGRRCRLSLPAHSATKPSQRQSDCLSPRACGNRTHDQQAKANPTEHQPGRKPRFAEPQRTIRARILRRGSHSGTTNPLHVKLLKTTVIANKRFNCGIREGRIGRPGNCTCYESGIISESRRQNLQRFHPTVLGETFCAIMQSKSLTDSPG